jgi:hypothetical protein
MLKTMPQVFEVYDMYVKAKINNVENKVYELTGLVKELSVNIENITRKSVKTKDSYQHLLKMSYAFTSHSWSIKLLSFIYTELGVENKYHIINQANIMSSVYNPKLALNFKNLSSSIAYLDSLKNIYGDSTSIKFWNTYIHSLDSVADDVDLTGNDIRTKIYKGRRMLTRNTYELAIPLYTSILKLPEITLDGRPHVYEDVIHSLFMCYIEVKSYKEAAALAVDNYLRNENIIIKFPLKSLLGKVESEKSINHEEIVLPLLFHIAGATSDKIYVAYDNFLFAHRVERPLDLIKKHDAGSAYLSYFLYFICNCETLYKSIYFTGSEDVEKYRIEILQYLIKTCDESNRAIYTEEIDKLTKILMTRTGIQQVNESRIYINILGILQTSYHYLEESFNRYMEFKTFTVEELKFIDVRSGPILLHLPKTESEKEFTVADARFSHNHKYLLFKDIFLELRDRFLFSKEYGLNSYLSVRIRHGTLTGQLRSIFQQAHLVTQKDDSIGDYLPNLFWDERIQDPEGSGVNKELIEFAIEVDDVIQKVKNEFMQIKTENAGGLGLFDYCYSEHELMKLYGIKFSDIGDLELFYETIVNELMDRTQANLREIRNVLLGQVRSELLSAIDKLYDQVSGYARLQGVAELLNAITNSKVEAQNEIDKITRWFTTSRQAGIENFDLNLVVDTSIEIINNVHRVRLSPNVNVEVQGKFIGEHFTHFVDVMVILLNNILSHSKMDLNDLHITINIDENNGNLNIVVGNTIGDVDAISLQQTIDSLKVDLLELRESEKFTTEGKTGYYKILKIFKYDLKREAYRIQPYIDDNGKFIASLECEIRGLKL